MVTCLRLSKKPVIASQCAHWRGNPFLKRTNSALFAGFCLKRYGFPRRFAPRSKCPWGTPRKDAVVREGDEETVGGETAQRILIVDDAPLNRAILREMLGDTFQLAEAADGAECMAQLEKYGTDIALVLLDMIMPGMDGIQVLEEMQRRELLDDIPVIMITADTSADSMSHAYELGVADYIERPFDVQVVRRRVMNTVKLYARQRRLRGFTG